MKYKDIIKVAEDELSPAIICNYLYDLVKTFNSLYQNHNILNAGLQGILDPKKKIAIKIKNIPAM